MGTTQFGIVVMMVVVRTAPDTARAEGQDAKDTHQTLGEAGLGQDCMMLLIVINHKQPQDQQSGEETADDLARQMEVPKRPRHGSRQQQSRGKHMPPTPGGGIHRKGLGRQDKFFAGSHLVQLV